MGTEEEFKKYAKCIHHTKRPVDLRDCAAPLQARMDEAARANLIRIQAEVAEIQKQMMKAQVDIDLAQQKMDEAFADLESAQSEGDRSAAIAARKAANEELVAQRDTLQGLREKAAAVAADR